MEQSIQQLEKQVRALSLQVSELQKEIRQSNQKRNTQQRNKQQQQTDSASSSASENNKFNQTTPPTLFKPGDRIRILNKVRRPTHWDDSQQWNITTARKATVTSVTSTRVYFTTDNNISTWRLYKHLRHE
jgi:TolA-binding protein